MVVESSRTRTGPAAAAVGAGVPVAGEFGNALVSRFRLRHSDIHAMPSGKEPRTVMEAHLETEAGLVAVFTTHWGLDDGERSNQARECVRRVEAFGGAALLLGDLNEEPDGPSIAILRNAETLEGYTPENSFIPSIFIHAITSDESSTVWMASSEGLIQSIPGGWQTWSAASRLRPDSRSAASQVNSWLSLK